MKWIMILGSSQDSAHFLHNEVNFCLETKRVRQKKMHS